MGSFRSEPELTKHTHTGNFDKIAYAVSHMCGIINKLIVRLENIYGRCSHIVYTIR
jgi:hypothetical protein